MKTKRQKTDFEEVTQTLAKLAEEKLPNGRPRFLFRGQSKSFGSINPTLARLEKEDEALAKHALRICQETMRIRSGITGSYPRGILDVLALLQHYGWWTPLIDLTGTPEVALWFAQFEWSPDDLAVVYIFDTQYANWIEENQGTSNGDDGVVVVDHDFLLAPPKEGGLQARWLRQDGFAVTTSHWRHIDAVKDFDLLKNHELLHSALWFEFPANYDSLLGDLCEEADDSLPASVQGALRVLIGYYQSYPDVELDQLKRINERIDAIHTGPSSPKINSIDEIESDVLLKPGRWAHLAFLVWLTRRCCLEIESRYPSQWNNSSSAINKALGRASAACRQGQIKPKGFNDDDAREVNNVSASHEFDLSADSSPDDIVATAARASSAVVGASLVYDYDVAAHCAAWGCFQDGLQILRILNAIDEVEILTQLQTVWNWSRENGWRDDIPFDPEQL